MCVGGGGGGGETTRGDGMGERAGVGGGGRNDYG